MSEPSSESSRLGRQCVVQILGLRLLAFLLEGGLRVFGLSTPTPWLWTSLVALPLALAAFVGLRGIDLQARLLARSLQRHRSSPETPLTLSPLRFLAAAPAKMSSAFAYGTGFLVLLQFLLALACGLPLWQVAASACLSASLGMALVLWTERRSAALLEAWLSQLELPPLSEGLAEPSWRRERRRLALSLGAALPALLLPFVHWLSLSPARSAIAFSAAGFCTLPLLLGLGLAFSGLRAPAQELDRLLHRLKPLLDRAKTSPSSPKEEQGGALPLHPELRAIHEALALWQESLESCHKAQRRAEEQAKQSTRLKSHFLALMSHDLRSPLNSIQGFSALLLSPQEGELNEAQKESVEAIRDAGGDLSRLVVGILDWAKIEAKRFHPNFRWLTVVELMNDAARQTKRVLLERGVDLRLSIQAGLPPIYADRSCLLQAVVCVLTHTIRALPSAQSLGFSAYRILPEVGNEARVAFNIRVEGSILAMMSQKNSSLPPRDENAMRSGDLEEESLDLFLARTLLSVHDATLHFRRGPDGMPLCSIDLPLRAPEEA